MGNRGRRAEHGRRRLACIALIAAGALVACRALVGIHDEPMGAGGGDGGASDTSVNEGAAGDQNEAGIGSIAWESPACGGCVESECSKQLGECLGDTGCAQPLACLARCAGNDDVCRSACFAQGDDTLAALLHCQAVSCAGDAGCGLRCGGFLGVEETDTTACTACYVQWACANATWCATQSLSCLGAQICLDACNPFDWVCRGNCFASHPDDVPDAAWGGDFSIANAQCASACNAGRDWGCVGHVSWPISHVSTVSFQVVVSDLTSPGVGLAGIELRLCPNGDKDCSSPLSGTTTTDGTGAATLSAPALFEGYIEATGNSTYAPTLTYFYPPIAESLTSLQYQGIQLVSSSYLAALGSGVGVALDPGLGIVIASPVDCLAQGAPGVSFGGSPLGDAAALYYVLNGNPTPPPEATATTLPNLLGGIVNVQPGTVDFVASVDGGTVSKVSVSVRAGAVTWLRNLVPTP